MKNILLRFIERLLKFSAVFLLIASTTFGWQPGKIVEKKSLSLDESGTRDYVKAIVEELSLKIGVRNFRTYNALKKSEEYIITEFKKLGYKVGRQSYSINGLEFSNIMATKYAGGDAPLIIAAHYDSCFNPGADDNASGVAGVLALARLLADQTDQPPIYFIAFVNEEPPYFLSEHMGSLVYARNLKKQNKNIKGAVVLEMIGYYSNELFSQKYLPLLGPFYPNRGNFIGIVGNLPSASLVKDFSGQFPKNSEVPIRSIIAPSFIPGIYFSDHWSFWQEHYPAIMVTDTAYLRNKNYHKNTDLPRTLNYDYMTVFIHQLKDALIKYVRKD